MADNAAEVLQTERVVELLALNESLGKSLMGLMRQILRQCDKYGWDPRTLWIRTPHLDARGFLELKYRPQRRGRGRYMDAYSATTIPGMLRQRNAEIAKFLRGCQRWRSALERMYEQTYAFAIDKGVKYSDVVAGSFHVETARRRAWCWIAPDGDTYAKFAAGGIG